MSGTCVQVREMDNLCVHQQLCRQLFSGTVSRYFPGNASGNLITGIEGVSWLTGVASDLYLWCLWSVSFQEFSSWLVLLFHMSIIEICKMSYVCPAGQPAVLHGWHLWHWTLNKNFSTRFFHTCYASMHHWPLLLYTLFTGGDLFWGSQAQQKAKLTGFIFSHTS